MSLHDSALMEDMVEFVMDHIIEHLGEARHGHESLFRCIDCGATGSNYEAVDMAHEANCLAARIKRAQAT